MSIGDLFVQKMEQFPSDSALKILENELTHGGELAEQLQLHLNAQSSSQETLVYLLNEILNTYDRALSVIKPGGTTTGGGASGVTPPGCSGVMVATMSDPPAPPLTGSPLSNESSGQENQDRRKSDEKGVPRWTQKVVVYEATRNETQLDDGYNWRKYGQKDIQQSRYPRGYYRCTHKRQKGCLAKKQVQQSDEDPTTFEITYEGYHTCLNNPPIPIQDELHTPSSHENLSQSQKGPFSNTQTSLNVLESSNDKQYNIPSSSNSNPENYPIFSDDNLLSEDYLRDFMYPTAPESNYFNDFEVLFNNSQDIDPPKKPTNQDLDSWFGSSSGLGSNFGFGNSSYFP